VNQTPEPPSHRAESPAPAPSSGANSRACNVCIGATFIDVDEQRAHYRSDWHRYNVKTRLNGGKAVSENQFAQLVDGMCHNSIIDRRSSHRLAGLEDSISGSASSSEGESDDADAVATLVQKTRNLARSPSPDSASPSVPQTALAWFHSPPSTQIGVYKALFPTSTPSSSYVDELKEMQKGGEEGRTWAMFMVAGGHFAGAIVRVKAPDSETDDQSVLTKKGKPRKPKPETEVLKHKTFHRYTSQSCSVLDVNYINLNVPSPARRKQGGSQSTNDNAKTKAVSAGAMLRRYGETALRDVSATQLGSNSSG